jgi:primase-polymerase (primpol)-like protein
VVEALERGLGDGLGFVFTKTPFAGVDLDKCIRADGTLEPWAALIVGQLNSYTELSPSHRGLHTLVIARLEGGGQKHGAVEVYDRGRYFTITGEHWAGTPDTIESRQAELAAFVEEFFGNPSNRARASGNLRAAPWNGKLPTSVQLAMEVDPSVRLILEKPHPELGFDSASEADFALARILVEVDFSDADVEAALRWRHAHLEPRPKSLNYFPRTVRNARTWEPNKRSASG